MKKLLLHHKFNVIAFVLLLAAIATPNEDPSKLTLAAAAAIATLLQESVWADERRRK